MSSTTNTKQTRRRLFKNTFYGGSTLFFMGALASCSKKAEQTAPNKGASSAGGAAAEPQKPEEFVSESSTMAQTLGYKEDASTVSKDLRIDKGQVKGADQFCSNCQFFTQTSEGQGRCTLFPGKLVKENGWCKSWTVKAKA